MTELLRIYAPEECGADGYPIAWHFGYATDGHYEEPPIKDLIREEAGYRCERCHHPYPPGIAATCPRGEWTPCDTRCTHGGTVRSAAIPPTPGGPCESVGCGGTLTTEAHWRILTVHHLNGVKWDCRWWNLAALCQRCHLEIQARVLMDRVYPFEHSEWFKPHAAGWYAAAYLGEELTREETLARLDELLSLERLV